MGGQTLATWVGWQLLPGMHTPGSVATCWRERECGLAGRGAGGGRGEGGQGRRARGSGGRGGSPTTAAVQQAFGAVAQLQKPMQARGCITAGRHRREHTPSSCSRTGPECVAGGGSGTGFPPPPAHCPRSPDRACVRPQTARGAIASRRGGAREGQQEEQKRHSGCGGQGLLRCL